MYNYLHIQSCLRLRLFENFYPFVTCLKNGPIQVTYFPRVQISYKFFYICHNGR